MAQKEVVDSLAMEKAITRISYEIIERNKNLDNLVLVGIKTRGVYIAWRIRAKIAASESISVHIAELDTRPYRDDERRTEMLEKTMLPTDVAGKDIILVDDVLYTGRTIRAAITALIALGRPARVQLAVLIDRGHRELPIRADYVGKNIPTSQKEEIAVKVLEVDGKDSVEINEN